MQALRKDRMQERWNCFKEEIWSILQYKEQALKKSEERDVYVSIGTYIPWHASDCYCVYIRM